MPSLRTAVFVVVLGAACALEALSAHESSAASLKVRPSADGAPPALPAAEAPKAPIAAYRKSPRGKKVAPAAAQTTASARSARAPRVGASPSKGKPACLHGAVGIRRDTEDATFPLTRCDGSPAPLAVERLSVLARPDASAPPPANVSALAKHRGPNLAPGVRRVDARLVQRLQVISDHFRHRVSAPPRVILVSGYRPASVGSYHADGKALDLRLDGVKNEDLVAFCKTLVDTGCGYYPNSSFVHVDVRDAGTGNVAWVDGSGPGESPHYLSAWPPPPSDAPGKLADEPIDPMRQLDPEASPIAVDEHPSTPHMGEEPDSELPPLPTFETPPEPTDGDPNARP